MPDYYGVGIGARPGIYRSWHHCEIAIGDRNPPPPQLRPQWKKYNNRVAALHFIMQFNERLPDGSLIPRHQHNQALEAQNEAQLALVDATQRNAQTIARLAQEVEELRREREKPEILSLAEALDSISLQVSDGPDANSGDIFRAHYNLTFQEEACEVYTHGAFFKGGPRSDTFKAGVGVWFGAESKMNVVMGFVNDTKSSKRNAEALAVLIALHVAKKKGIQRVLVYCCNAAVRKCVITMDATGASQFMFSKLIKMLESFALIQLADCRESARGVKEAKNLAESHT